MTTEPSKPELAAQLTDLRARLAEAEEALRAIRNGEVDGVLATGARGEQVYTLHGADRAYRQLIEAMSEGAATLSADGVILYCNARLAQMVGRPIDQVLGTDLRDYLPPADQSALDAVLAQVHTAPIRREINLKACDGRRVPVYLSASCLQSEEAKMIFCLVLTDLTEQRVQAVLRESEEKFRAMFENMAAGSCIDEIVYADGKPVDYRVLDINPAFERLIGVSHSQAVGALATQLYGATPPPFFDLYVKVAETGEPVSFEGYFPPIGKHLHITASCPAKGRFSTIITDITERMQLETYRAMSREVLQILNDPGALPETLQRVINAVKTRTGFDAVGLRLQDGEDFPYYAQEGLSKDFLLTENTLLERDADGGVCRDKNGNVSLECTCGLVISGKTDAASPLFTKGGSFWTNDSFPLLELPPAKDPRHHPRNQCIHQGYASVALVPIRNQERIVGLLHLNDRRKGRFSIETIELLEGIAVHIGAALMRKRAEEALLEKTAFLNTLLEAMPVPVFYKDAEGHYTGINKAFEAFYGKTRVELIGKSVFDIAPRELAEVYHTKDLELLHNPGTQVYDAKMKDSQGLMHDVVYHKATFQNSDGKVIGLIGVILDITERKQAEAEHEKLQAQFTQAQKMESVGRLAGGVAHDFNNLLMGTMGYTQLCLDKIGPEHPIREYLEEIMSGTERSAELTHQLLAFARKQIIAPRVLDLNETISGMIKLLRRLIGEDVTMKFTEDPDTWPVKMDPVQIDQILANLCVNARDAIGGVGSVSIETSNATFDESCCAANPESVPGEYALLSVTDSGCGMDKETLAHIFEPFFTTKGLGEGTGLGLATVFGIVKQNNGYINVYSEPGKGTTFRIYLPRHVCEDTAQAVVAALAKPPHGTETVLLVEDEKSIRVTTHMFLEDLGYTVLVAEDPAKALALAAQHPGEIRLLITDVIMPGMSGRDLANRLAELRPAIKRLFISGFTADVIAQRGILDDGVNFLSKPFGRDVLARKVREVLEEKGEKK